ncbi:MAG: hypothetical protein OEZ04_05375 [Nitrospinota bacterium]|nr:hypothetical protein [Nitrospinota bacterium]
MMALICEFARSNRVRYVATHDDVSHGKTVGNQSFMDLPYAELRARFFTKFILSLGEGPQNDLCSEGVKGASLAPDNEKILPL